jgi:hypothetical protein
MGSLRRRVKHTSSFEERLAEEAKISRKRLKADHRAAHLGSCFFDGPGKPRRHPIWTTGCVPRACG